MIVTRWDTYHHPLASPRQEYSVGIGQIPLPVVISDNTPTGSAELVERPVNCGCSIKNITEVRIPADTDPIQFQPLNIKLSGGTYGWGRSSDPADVDFATQAGFVDCFESMCEFGDLDRARNISTTLKWLGSDGAWFHIDR